MNICNYCNKNNADMMCSKCKIIYCSKDCQKNDWKIHKLVCNDIEFIKPKVALCLRGAVGKIKDFYHKPGSVYENVPYVNYKAAYNSTIEHLINANPDYDFDIFIHCWSLDLEEELLKLYKPKAYKFENNNDYIDEIVETLRVSNKPIDTFGDISKLLTLKKVISIMKEYSELNKIKYEYVFIYRTDVLLFKDIKLNLYDKNKIYSNGYHGSDYHFVMNQFNSYKFSEIYNTTKYPNIVSTYQGCHGIHNIYVKYFMNNGEILIDDIEPGKYQDCIRKISYNVDYFGVPIKTLMKYGITRDELKLYRNSCQRLPCIGCTHTGHMVTECPTTSESDKIAILKRLEQQELDSYN